MFELFIENRKIELNDDIQVSFTYESINPDKLSSIKNSFSKTVDIPGTDENNETFGHLFRIDRYVTGVVIPDGNGEYHNIGYQYDPHSKADYILYNNGSVVNSGYCTLDNIVVNGAKVTYKVTLYGGIGNFFYNLTYNEDGSSKTLYDLKWSWNSVLSVNDNGTPMSQSQEDTTTMMVCSPAVICKAYHTLKPEEEIIRYIHMYGNPDFWNEEFQKYYPFTRIDKDVVFLPCYVGKYDDFDSNKMLVNIANEIDEPNEYLSDPSLSGWQRAFPVTVTDGDGVSYTAMSENIDTQSSNRYGLVTFSRDLDAWESGDIRVNEMPVALRLSKLLRTVSQPWNNGGYTVEWDEEITSSPYWKYSWITLGKITQETESPELSSVDVLQYDGTYRFGWLAGENAINGNPYYTSNTAITGSIPAGDYVIRMCPKPKITFDSQNLARRIKNNIGKYTFTSSETVKRNNVTYHRQNVFVTLNEIYVNGTHNKTTADIFYVTTNEMVSKFGEGLPSTEALVNAIKTRLQEQYGHDISSIVVRNITPALSNEYSNEDYGGVDCIDADFEQVEMSTFVSVSNSSTIAVSQKSCSMFVDYTSHLVGVGIWGVDTPTYDFEYFFSFIDDDGDCSFFGNLMPKQTAVIANFSDNTIRSGIYTRETTGFSRISLTKSTLFHNSESPMKYLVDFCKLMNYRFILDEVQKKVYVKTLKNYYVGSPKNIDALIDYSRDISIKNITTKYKRIDFGLSSLETYPIMLFNRISTEKFNTYKYTTNINWNQETTSLLSDSLYSNVSDWQLSSQFFKRFSPYPRAYNTPTISWTLFNNNDNELGEYETITTGAKMEQVAEDVDYLPKIAFFDIDNKYTPAKNNLVFLNGFVKNYVYNYVYVFDQDLTPDEIVQDSYIDSTHNTTASQYQDIYVYNNIDANCQHKAQIKFTSGYTASTFNYYNGNGEWIGSQYPGYETSQGSAVVVTLLLPSATKTIRMNVLKASAADFWMERRVNKYVVFPKTNFTEDYGVQYYLNGKRCYISDFTYHDNFAGWGTYSNRGTASSYALPFFTRDLFNEYVPTYEDSVIEPVAVVDGAYFTVTDGAFQTHSDANWEIRYYTIRGVDSPKFTAQYPNPSLFTGNVLAEYAEGGTFVRVEGIFGSAQYEFARTSINTFGGVIEVRMNVYKPNSATTFIEGYTQTGNHWYSDGNIKASWNLVTQNNLTNYSLVNTTFITNPDYSYDKIIYTWNTPNLYPYENDYSLSTLSNFTNRIYSKNWYDYMNDLYDRNTRDVTVYIDLTTLGMPNDILRGIYNWQGYNWIVTKIDSMKPSGLGNDKFTKCTLHKIKNIDTWTNQ